MIIRERVAQVCRANLAPAHNNARALYTRYKLGAINRDQDAPRRITPVRRLIKLPAIQRAGSTLFKSKFNTLNAHVEGPHFARQPSKFGTQLHKTKKNEITNFADRWSPEQTAGGVQAAGPPRNRLGHNPEKKLV